MADHADHVFRRLLVLRCQLGDRSAFEELVRHCQPRLGRFLARILGSQASVDDLIQEIWMDVLRSIPQLDDPGAFFPWLYRIAHNRAFAMLRRRRPMAALADLDLADPASEETDFNFDDQQAVQAALEQLAPEHREVLLLRFAEDMSYEQIAHVVGCQLGTVRSRIHNAKRNLRRILQKAAHP